jgi:uncharacterized protein
MENSRETARLRIYASSTDKTGNQPVYEAIIYHAKNSGLAGATAFRGVMGFGLSSVVHTSKLWELTEKLPVLIEIVDEKEKIIKFYETIEPVLKSMSKGCLVTIENVEILLCQEGK